MLEIGRHDEKCMNGEIRFTFAKGPHKHETYRGCYSTCPNPFCDCQWVELQVQNEPAAGERSASIQYRFALDLIEEDLAASNTRRPLDKVTGNFARAFIDGLSREDWEKLAHIYYSLKVKITEETPVDDLEVDFPLDEDGSLPTVFFHSDIFPFRRPLRFTSGGREYLIDDQYCLNPKCTCKDAIITFLPIADNEVVEPPNGFITVSYDHTKRNWEPVEDMPLPGDPTRIVRDAQKSIPTLAEIFKDRHSKLKILFKKYKRKFLAENAPSQPRPIARNAPCPCGSGKKYKRCCGKD